MKNSILYGITVLIWGSTWIAIEFQLGKVAVEVSVFYRFGLAAIIMWVYCLWRGIPLKFSLRNHGFFLLLALGNFSANYTILYTAQNYLNSAMTILPNEATTVPIRVSISPHKVSEDRLMDCKSFQKSTMMPNSPNNAPI